MSIEIRTIISNAAGRTAYVRNGDKTEQHVFPVGTSDADIVAKLESPDRPDDGNTPDAAAAELEKLRQEAKKLGIRSAHNMKVETLIARIKEAKGE